MLHDFILSGADITTGQSVQRYRRLLDASQRWSEGEIEEYQNERLQFVVRQAYENIPFYRELMSDQKISPDDVRTKDDLWKLPVLSKETLRGVGCERIVSRALRPRDLIRCASSGSTGSPFEYYVTRKAYSANKACLLRAWEWMGYKLGDSYGKISRRTRRSLMKRAQDFFNHSLYLAPADLSATNLTSLWEKLRRFSPRFIRSYPDMLVFLADFAEREGLEGMNGVTAISTTGSTLGDEKRRKIERWFGAPVYDSYSSEGGAIVAQCESRNCYHSAGEYAISEFLDIGSAAPSGTKRLIVTDLHNTAMPFIRYDTADLVIPAEDICACGRNLPGIQRIAGREGDVLITPEGRPLLVHDFSTHFSHHEVESFQIIQEKIDAFTVKIVAPRISREGMDRIRRNVQKKIGAACTIDLQIVEELNPTGAGKRRLLVRNPEV